MNSKLKLQWIEDVNNDDDDDDLKRLYSEQTMRRSSSMMNHPLRHRSSKSSSSSSSNIHCMVLSRMNLDRRSRRMTIHSQSLQDRRRILRSTKRILFPTTTTTTTKMITMIMISIILCTTTTAFPGSSYVPNHFHHFRIHHHHHHYYSKRQQFLVFQATANNNNDNGNDRIEDEIQQLLQGAATAAGGTGGKIGDNNMNTNDAISIDDDSNTNKVPLQKVFVSDGDLDEATQLEIEEGQPSEMMIMKQLLGINGFTVLLGVLIVFFLSMNTLLGVGWLGKFIGIPGTGTFEEMSPSLPALLDLNRPEFRL